MNKQEIEKAIELMKNEVNCILRASNCDRECEKCDLVKTDTELLAAYEKAINALERQLTWSKMDVKEIARKDNISLAEREFLENYCREVVFCGDCCLGEKIKDTNEICCYRLGKIVLPTDFCSRGERK